MSKRFAELPTLLQAFHNNVSKATLHEALLDLWLEHNGLDIHPANLTEAQRISYREDVKRRSKLRQQQGRT